MSPVADGTAGVVVAGDPTEEEVAAIMAAVEVVWPRPVAAGPADDEPRWRFSGRWWSRPIPIRRVRP